MHYNKTLRKVTSFVTFLLFVFFSPLNCRLFYSLFFIILTVESSNTPGAGGGGGDGGGGGYLG